MECTIFSYHRAKPWFHLPFSGLVLGGRGCLNEILIFFHFLLKNEERNVLDMEETRFKTDHSQHGKDQKRTGRLRISAPKIILFVLGCRKKKTKSIRKEKRSINYSKFFSPVFQWGFGCLKRALNFYTPVSIQFI